jgi:uncharacterized protein (TIGR02001 family)
MQRKQTRVRPHGLLLAATLLSGLASGALAQGTGTRSISVTAGATSDFVFRGLSYTRGKPAGLASFDIEFPSSIYFGGFVSSADPNPGPSPKAELDFWLGKAFRLGDTFSADVRLTHYMYPNDPRVADYDRDELTLTLGVKETVFLAATWSPNTESIGSLAAPVEGDSVWAVELSARRPIGSRFSLGAGVGYYELDEIYLDGYLYWNLTLSADFTPFELQLAALGADSAAEDIFGTRSAGERLAVTALYRFHSTR